jgi:aspartate-semialdehyde dehydrogenase
MRELSVAVLGATGALGQQYVKMLLAHPFLRLTCVTGFSSVGRRLREAAKGELRLVMHPLLDELVVKPTEPEAVDADLVFSPLPSEVAKEKEPHFAQRGLALISDASAHRLEPDVPLLIPEVNPEQLQLIRAQRLRRGWKGLLVATPNCTATGLALVLKPLQDAFGIRRVLVSSLQAVSGAGYPGLPSLDILENVIPYIEGEEEKVQEEPRKVLAELKEGRLEPPSFVIEALCHRVPTLEGHMESLVIEFDEPVHPDRAKEALRDFRGLPQELKLPSAPERPIIVLEERDRPQTRLDRMAGSVPGMSVVVGRIRRGQDAHVLKLTLLVHNEIRGGAGGAILSAELMAALGLVGEG